VTEAPPPPPGSSLPYILPLTVCGGALIVLPAMAVEAETESLLAGFFALPYGAGLMLAGLSLGELRRFFWRLEWLGQALSRAAKSKSPIASVRPAAFATASLIMLGALTSSACCLVCFLAAKPLHDRAELAVTICFSLLGVGGYMTLYLLTLLAVRTVAAWDGALRLWSKVRGSPTLVLPPDRLATFLAVFAGFWAVGILVAFRCELPDYPPDLEVAAGFFAVLSGAATAAWLGALLVLLNRGTRILEALAPLPPHSQLSLRPLPESLGLPDGWLGTCLFVLLGLILLILALTVLAIAGEYGWGIILLVCTAPMFLGAWLAMATAFAVRAVRALTRAAQKKDGA